MATTNLAAMSAAAAPQASNRVSHVAYLDYFRATSILAVVLVHAGNAVLLRSLTTTGGETYFAVRTGLHLLSYNSTVYFAAISGILYAYTLHRKPHGVFMRSRLTNVALPYTVVTIALTMALYGYAMVRRAMPFDAGELSSEIVYNVLLGEAWNTLWYIPVVMVLYLISPLLLTCVTNSKYRSLAWLIALMPLVVSRTGTAVTPSMVCYFIGTYTVGLMIGSDLSGTMDRFRRNIGWLVAAVALSATAIVMLDRSGTDYLGTTSLRESGFYVLRLSLTAITLVWLQRWPWDKDARISRLMDLFARFAFGIYFIHGPLLRPVAKAIGGLLPSDAPSLAVVLAIAATFLAGGVLSLAIVSAIVRVAGPHAKWIIGAAPQTRVRSSA